MLELVTDTRVDLSVSGARFGLGAFETLRVQGGKAWKVSLHLERLAAACAFLGLEGPPAAGEVEAALPLPERGVLRLLAVDRQLLAWAGPVDAVPVQGLRLGLSLETVRMPGPLTRHKTTSYLENLRLMAEARARGLEEVVAPTPRGRLSDGGRSTLLVERGGRLLTPPVEDGALPGIGRRVLLEAGLAEEASLVWADLGKAQGAGLVSALRGLRMVVEAEGLAAYGAPGPVWTEARKALLQA